MSFLDLLRFGPNRIPEGRNYSYDWCRFRRDSHCYYPKELDEPATTEAGYAVWIPLDRGFCGRAKWQAQQRCPVSEPGPHVPGGLTDATVAWADGGQHGGIPAPNSPYTC